MTDVYRNPVAGYRTVPPTIACVGAACSASWNASMSESWQCPNQLARNGLCATTSFAYPRGPRSRDPSQFHFHQGIDIGGPRDFGHTEIISVVDGTVVEAYDRYDGKHNRYGMVVIVESEGYFYFHAHCHQLLVAKNDTVVQKQPIAIVGASDWHAENPTSSMGEHKAHLHFEVRNALVAREESVRGRDGQVRISVREDPVAHLAGLGPWGPPRPIYFPVQGIVTPTSAESLHDQVERTPSGGYFPLGSRGLWHGGVHLPVSFGLPLTLPLRGTIVALRLDESPSTSLRKFGSTNFILVRHQVPSTVLRSMRGEAHHAGSANETPPRSVPGEQINVEAGTGGVEMIKGAKRMLSHIRSNRGERVPYYTTPLPPGSAPMSLDAATVAQDLADGTMNPALRDALARFQWDRCGRRAMGRVFLAPSPEWRRMRSLYVAAVNAAAREARRAAAQARRDANASALRARREAAARGEPPPVTPSTPIAELPETIYSLFMHLSAVELSVALSDQLTWLKVASVPVPPEEQAAETARLARLAEESRLERTESRYRIRARVGGPEARPARRNRPPRPPIVAPNRPEDVEWVQKRLARFGCDPGRTDGVVEETPLTNAIRKFQSEHVRAFMGRPAAEAPGFVNASGTTVRALRGRPPTSGATAEPVNARFLRAVRERDPNGTTKVLTDLAIPVAAGSPLFLPGWGPFHPATGHAATLHWEMFSHTMMLPENPSFDDTNDDLLVNSGAEHIMDAVNEQLGLPAETQISLDAPGFYRAGHGEMLRDHVVRFRSEWSLDPANALSLLDSQGISTTRATPASLAPFSWWSDAASVLPPSPRVWHYNPIAFVESYADHAHTYVGSIEVTLTDARGVSGQATITVGVGRESGTAPPYDMNIGETANVAILPPGGNYSVFVWVNRDIVAERSNIVVEIGVTTRLAIELGR